MGDDNSSDVVLVESHEENSKPAQPTVSGAETRPLMQLLQRLISNNTKENTILTNTQIIDILQKEFNIEMTELHDLELDIYLNIIKKFLKDWPQWDEFDHGITTLRKRKAEALITTTLELKYKDLKEYLKGIIDESRPRARAAVNKMLKEKAEVMKKVCTSDIVFEIYCSRKQLNDLILNHPSQTPTQSIFNIANYKPPNHITANSIPIEAILNWWGIKLTIEMIAFSYSRTTMHELKQVLVNKNNGPRNLKQVLNDKLQIREQKSTMEYVIQREKYIELFEDIELSYDPRSPVLAVLRAVFQMIMKDLESINGDIVVPATYRQYSNKYPYYRKLCKKVDSAAIGSNYNLYIEEKISPMHVFFLGKVRKFSPIMTKKDSWLLIECAECKLKFNGVDLLSSLIDHYNAFHSGEPDWICTNCEKSFPMIHLAQNRWHHICDIQDHSSVPS